MDNKSIYMISLIGLLLVSPIATYLVVETGKTLSCSTGWILQDDGKYMCKTTSSIRYSYCSKVWNTATGKQNYYCKEAKLEEIPKIIETEKGNIEVCDHTKCI
jgi:hypothetical protein